MPEFDTRARTGGLEPQHDLFTSVIWTEKMEKKGKSIGVGKDEERPRHAETETGEGRGSREVTPTLSIDQKPKKKTRFVIPSVPSLNQSLALKHGPDALTKDFFLSSRSFPSPCPVISLSLHRSTRFAFRKLPELVIIITRCEGNILNASRTWNFVEYVHSSRRDDKVLSPQITRQVF